MNAEAPGRIRGGLNHPALIATSTHHQQLEVPQLRVILATDLDEERVQVHMDDAGGHEGAYTRRMAVALSATTTCSPPCSPISSADAVVTDAIRRRPTSR
jgi:hypothetical protein